MGLTLINAANCRMCHADDLSGNFNGVYFTGHVAPAFPPNLTPDPATGLGCWTDMQIVTSILDGVDNMGQPLCPPMPHYREMGLDTADALAITAYLRTRLPVSNAVPSNPPCNGWGEPGGGCISTPDCANGDAGACIYQYCLAGSTDAGTVVDASVRDATIPGG